MLVINEIPPPKFLGRGYLLYPYGSISPIIYFSRYAKVEIICDKSKKNRKLSIWWDIDQIFVSSQVENGKKLTKKL